MASVVDICNKALSLIGQRHIVSFDDDSPEALACRTHWQPLRDEKLREHPWNFATVRVALNRLVDVPAFGFAYYHQLPTDCLKVLNIEPEGFFEVEGRYLLSDTANLSLKYIKTLDDTTNYDSQIAAALAYLLAAELAYLNTASTSLASELRAIGEDKLHAAKQSDSLEGRRSKRIGRWLASHYG